VTVEIIGSVPAGRDFAQFCMEGALDPCEQVRVIGVGDVELAPGDAALAGKPHEASTAASVPEMVTELGPLSAAISRSSIPLLRMRSAIVVRLAAMAAMVPALCTASWLSARAIRMRAAWSSVMMPAA
jgi:pyruvate/2-oxoglutarate dehydrogenase complex dihydrolipoamide acyltransferase (E2) component